MPNPVLLLIDLTQYGPSANLIRPLDKYCELHVKFGGDNISESIERLSPKILCFVYDHIDSTGLGYLSHTKAAHPSLPVLMVTGQHSEPLAVWALRARVWDYFVMPVKKNELLDSIRSAVSQDNREQSGFVCPPMPLPPEIRFSDIKSENKEKQRLQISISYVEKSLHTKIQQKTAAELCGMSSCQFSRKFKAYYGVTFQEFVLQQRVNEARRLLLNPNMGITDVAYTVGFTDGAHFSRTYKRFTGESPSEYASRHRNTQNPDCPPCLTSEPLESAVA